MSLVGHCNQRSGSVAQRNLDEICGPLDVWVTRCHVRRTHLVVQRADNAGSLRFGGRSVSTWGLKVYLRAVALEPPKIEQRIIANDNAVALAA